MNWRTHINKLWSNLARYFSVFFNIRSSMPDKLRKTLYYAILYSRLQYVIEVYRTATKTIINQLYVTQNKLLKVSFNKHHRYHTNNLYWELKLLKSEDIFNSLLLQFVHCIVRNNYPETFKDYFKTRETVLDLTQETTRSGKNSFKKNYGKRTNHCKGATSWNQLKSKIRETSYSVSNEGSPNTTIHYWTFCFCTMASSWSLSHHIEYAWLFIFLHMSVMWMHVHMWKVYSRTKEYCLLALGSKRNVLMYILISTIQCYDTVNKRVCILSQISVSSNI